MKGQNITWQEIQTDTRRKKAKSERHQQPVREARYEATSHKPHGKIQSNRNGLI